MAGLDRSVTLTVKVTPADAEAIKQAAAKHDMSVSEFIRAATLVWMAVDGDSHAVKLLARGALRVTVEVWEKVRAIIPASKLGRPGTKATT
jgi:uncharacterized protein (DUF1778 family)